jgi:hypothetical protein
MPTPVEITHIKRSAASSSGVEGLGGTWNGRPWYMTERWLISAVERGTNFSYYVHIDGRSVPLSVVSVDGRKHLMAAGKPVTHLGLRAWRDVDERGWPVLQSDIG